MTFPFSGSASGRKKYVPGANVMDVWSLAVPRRPSRVVSVGSKSPVCSPSDINSSPGLDSQLPQCSFSHGAFNDSCIWLSERRMPPLLAGERRLRRVTEPSRGVCRWRLLGGTAPSIRRAGNRFRVSLEPQIISWIESLRLRRCCFVVFFFFF